jgi:hypothetical protein
MPRRRFSSICIWRCNSISSANSSSPVYLNVMVLANSEYRKDNGNVGPVLIWLNLLTIRSADDDLGGNGAARGEELLATSAAVGVA